MGWRFGAIVFILDILKGLGAVAIGFWLGGSQGIAAAAFGVVLGHDFPVWLNFRGGKGVAATIGILLSLFPLPTLIGIIVFVLVVVLTRMVSLGSLIFVIGMAAYTLISDQPAPLAVAVVGIALFAILRHRSNIQRIIDGTEKLISF
jgi:glycerol-3-phosphate acyltransferase PlsY